MAFEEYDPESLEEVRMLATIVGADREDLRLAMQSDKELQDTLFWHTEHYCPCRMCDEYYVKIISELEYRKCSC